MWPPVSPIDGLISGDNLPRFFVFASKLKIWSRLSQQLCCQINLCLVLQHNFQQGAMLEDGEGSGDFILMRIKLSKWALHVSFLSPPPPCSASSRTFVRSPPPFLLQGFTKGAALFSALSNNPDFPPNSWLQMIKFSLLGNKILLPVFQQPDSNFLCSE